MAVSAMKHDVLHVLRGKYIAKGTLAAGKRPDLRMRSRFCYLPMEKRLFASSAAWLAMVR